MSNHMMNKIILGVSSPIENNTKATLKKFAIAGCHKSKKKAQSNLNIPL